MGDNKTINQTHKFDKLNWTYEFMTLISVFGILLFVARTGVQNGSFSALPERILFAIGFTGYVMISGIRLLSQLQYKKE